MKEKSQYYLTNRKYLHHPPINIDISFQFFHFPFSLYIVDSIFSEDIGASEMFCGVTMSKQRQKKQKIFYNDTRSTLTYFNAKKIKIDENLI